MSAIVDPLHSRPDTALPLAAITRLTPFGEPSADAGVSTVVNSAVDSMVDSVVTSAAGSAANAIGLLLDGATEPGWRSAPTSTSNAVRSNAVEFLIVDQTGQLGGGELAMLPLLAAWSRRCELVLLTDGPFHTLAKNLGVQVSILSEPRISSIRKNRGVFAALLALGAISRQIGNLRMKMKNVDVVYLNSQKALVLGCIASAAFKKPVVWHAHDIMSSDHFGWMQRAIVKFVVRRHVEHVIANSAATAHSVAALTGFGPENITVLHNGISAHLFDAIPPELRATLRAELGIPADSFAVGLFGRLTHWKGTHVALQALALAPGAHLVIVGTALFGEKAYEQSLKKQAETLGIAERVHFLGFRNDIPALMKAVDAVLHSSIVPEPFGRVIVEGMLARRPVIATAAGGVLEIIDHRSNGLLVPPNDPYAIADALRLLASAPAWAHKLGQTAYLDAAARFSVDHYVESVSRILDGAKS